MPKLVDITGEKFGRWTVLGFSHISETRRYLWTCVCECGIAKLVDGSSLRRGISTGCGCARSETKVQGRTSLDGNRTGTYYSWDNMIGRCTRPSQPDYEDYGGRGITVCDRWLTFSNFFADMGHRPEGMTIDRIDTNGNYEPNNCKWSTNLEQQQNKRNTRTVIYNGRSMRLTQAAELSGIDYSVLYARMKLGWAEEDLFKPNERKRWDKS